MVGVKKFLLSFYYKDTVVFKLLQFLNYFFNSFSWHNN